MELPRLEQYVYQLATLKQTESPVVSCYLDLSQSEARFSYDLQERAELLEKSLRGQDLIEFHEAMQAIESYLEHNLDPHSKGIAFFSRAGHDPLFLALEFQVPVPNWLVTDNVPNIYHLIELKEIYHRFIIVLVNHDGQRIVEVNMGRVTESVWADYPDARQRVGSEWSKTYYQRFHSSDHELPLWSEVLSTLAQLNQAGGYKYLILAGMPSLTQSLQALLPDSLQPLLINTVAVTDHDSISTIVNNTLKTFIEQMQQQSMTSVTQVHQAICRGGLATAGLQQALYALQRDQVDLLIIDSAYVNKRDRETLVRLATQTGCKIETVHENSLLQAYGGVGCLLRMPLPATYAN